MAVRFCVLKGTIYHYDDEANPQKFMKKTHISSIMKSWPEKLKIVNLIMPRLYGEGTDKQVHCAHSYHMSGLRTEFHPFGGLTNLNS